jgi:ribosomal-protein-alanine N-acetyltransferase
VSEIRALTVDDLDAVTALEARAQPLPWSEDQLLLELVHDDARVLGASVEGALVGYIAVRRIVDEAWVLNVAVDPAHRRRGLGGALLAAARAHALTWGARSLWLEVRAGNMGARALYARAGLTERGQRPGYYPPLPLTTERETAVLMAMELAPG